MQGNEACVLPGTISPNNREQHKHTTPHGAERHRKRRKESETHHSILIVVVVFARLSFIESLLSLCKNKICTKLGWSPLPPSLPSLPPPQLPSNPARFSSLLESLPSCLPPDQSPIVSKGSPPLPIPPSRRAGDLRTACSGRGCRCNRASDA